MTATNLLLLAALLVTAAVVLLVIDGRRRRSAEAQVPASIPVAPTIRIVRRPPVVLVHGLMGFDMLRLPGGRLHYFRGVARHLRDLGLEVHVARVPPVRRIRSRAEVLAPQLGRATDPKVVVIGHSMGGLDARYAVSRLGAAARVAALVTVGTPHRGTPLADLGTAIVSRMLAFGGLLERVGIDPAAFRDLTTEHMSRFNAAAPDMAGVRYGSIVARAVPPIQPLLVPAYAYLNRRAGENDGLVPTSSQRWGEVLAEVEADHYAAIGWSSRFDAIELYADILRRLGIPLPVSTPARDRKKQRLLSAG